MSRDQINLKEYNQFGKNHKPLKDMVDEYGNQIYQISRYGTQRIWYVVDGDEKKIIKVFEKINHRTTRQSLNK